MNTKKSKKIKSKFNPVKEESGDVRAQRVIWTTEALDTAVSALAVGKRLKINPFYENEVKLLKADLVYERTDEEIEEWQKCRNDIIYFADKYCKMMTPEGIQHIELRDYQRDYLEHLMNNRLSIFLSCRQSGKCNSLITKVLCKFDYHFWDQAGEKIKNSWKIQYYIKEEDLYELPLFEILNVYESGWLWKLKYPLYKILYKLTCLKEKKNPNKIPGKI